MSDNRIDQLVAGRKRTRWTKQQLALAQGPIVYIFWGSDGTALYVGRSHVGLARPMEPSHRIDTVKDETGDFEFICCGSNQDANALEIELIRELQPKYNQRLHSQKAVIQKRLKRSITTIRDGVYAGERKDQFFRR